MTRGLSLGWLPDLPDHRDFSPEHKEVKTLLSKSTVLKPTKPTLKKSVDLSKWCSRIEDQGQLGSCTANAGVGLIEYYEKRAFGVHLDASRLFLYKATRNLMGLTGDTGAYLRDTMKAMVLFGAPPEKYVPYDIGKFDEEPSAFCYSFARNYKTISYFRLDPPGVHSTALLERIKVFLAAGYPSMFGFTVYNFGNDDGEFEYPSENESVKGGHAIVAIGYDDDRKIGNTKGALKIRNSWGTDWGQSGYGWLPYKYVEEDLATDFWTLFKSAYVNTKQFD
jgi:C1A family cysteine protease